jgi:hypothetical protein
MSEDVTLFTEVDRTGDPDFFIRFLDQGVGERLVGPGQRPPPHAEAAGIMPHPEIAVEDDAIHAIVAAAQQISIQGAQPIRRAGRLQPLRRPPQTAPRGPLFRSPVCETA